MLRLCPMSLSYYQFRCMLDAAMQPAAINDERSAWGVQCAEPESWQRDLSQHVNVFSMGLGRRQAQHASLFKRLRAFRQARLKDDVLLLENGTRDALQSTLPDTQMAHGWQTRGSNAFP